MAATRRSGEQAGLEVQTLGAPIDVLWFRLSESTSDPRGSMGRFDAGAIFVLINRRDYWQCGYVIPKGAIDEVRGAGLPAFQAEARALAAVGGRSRAARSPSWDQVKLLTVQIDRLKQWWRPGLLCIGDAAHAMSPVGGVGINLAIQDAVAAGNMLRTEISRRELKRVQDRREWPVRVTQRLQILVQDRIIARVLRQPGAAAAAAVFAAGGPLFHAAPHPGPPDRHGRAPGACKFVRNPGQVDKSDPNPGKPRLRSPRFHVR